MSKIELKPCAVCGADEASTYLGAPGPGVVRCFAVGCDAIVGGYKTDEEAIEAWNARSAAMDAAMAEAYCTKADAEDELTDCFRHHVRTTIGWQAFGARPGPEMQMYEEGFKAGYRRCTADNEPELGEEPDAVGALKALRWIEDYAISYAELGDVAQKAGEAILQVERLVKALEPFARFAENVAYQEGEFADGFVWHSAIHRESISTWFGPSDFGTAFEAIAAISKDEPRP